MAIWISNIKMPASAEESELREYAARAAGIPAGELGRVRLIRRSLDARKKSDIHYLLSVQAEPAPDMERRLLVKGNALIQAAAERRQPEIVPGKQPHSERIIVAGLGPAGLFAAYLLAQYGYRPLVVERGKPVLERTGDVERRWAGNALNPESNVMFGEGGAGTFSDGKLTSRSRDPRVESVFRLFNECGAQEDILFDAKPHIGTDRLRDVVSNLRQRICAMGGEVWFNTKMTMVHALDGNIGAVTVSRGGGEEKIPCCALILAIGQGARDTVEMLYGRGIAMERKPFAVGVRAEHPQSWLDRAQYGALAGKYRLGAADYRLAARSGERGVYTFCMCPGGVVIDAASQEGQIVVNGMSYHDRGGANANAAIVVQVAPEDVPNHPLGGIRFCEKLETASYLAGEGLAPSCRIADFMSGQAPRAFMGVQPSYRPGVRLDNLRSILPDFVIRGLKDGIGAFGRQLRGYDDGDAVLTAVESRTSAPYRILRNASMESVAVGGLYPVGEGAGYAGGIVSSAVDGLKAAEAVIGRFRPC